MKTKPFLLATAGSTVDGRNIDDAMIEQMASSYDPKTYGARLNIEHIRGISGQAPFRAYGDVLELSTGEVDVNFNGKTEKRKALFGVFDVTDEAKQLNDAGQKVYPSIEIEPNFAGKGYAYFMGCALTDSPAAIATERLEFNRTLPGTIQLSRDTAAPLEFADEAASTDEAVGTIAKFFSALTDKLSGGGAKEPEKPAPPEPQAQTFDAAAFTKGLGETLEQAFAKNAAATREEIDGLATKLSALTKQIENTEDPNFSRRPAALGPGGGGTKTDC